MRAMSRLYPLPAAMFMYAIGLGFAASALAGAENPAASQDAGKAAVAAVQPVAGQSVAAQPVAAQSSDASKYPGFVELATEHAKKQAALSKKWQALKAMKPADEKALAEYRKAQASVVEASTKVSEYMNQSKWTDDDKRAMTKIWEDILAKTTA